MPSNSSIRKQVFIAPGSKEHINKSVIPSEALEEPGKLTSLEGLIPIENVADTLTDEEKKRLEEAFPDNKVRMWGARPGLKGIWDYLNEGDYVIFYSNNYYICKAEAAFKTVNEKLADKVWGRHETGETWTYVFFVKNVRPLNMHRKDFNKTTGYSEDFVPQGFMRVAKEEAKDRIIREIIRVRATKIQEEIYPEITHLEKALIELGKEKLTKDEILTKIEEIIKRDEKKELKEGWKETTWNNIVKWADKVIKK